MKSALSSLPIILFATALVLAEEKTPPEIEDASITQIARAKKTMRSIHTEEKILDYIVRISRATRNPEAFGMPELASLISYGVSPRASIWLAMASQAHAFLSGRGYVTPQDVKSMAPDVLRHRIILSYEAEAEGKTTDDIIATLLERIEVP